MKTTYHIIMPSGIRPAIADLSEMGTRMFLINRINVPDPFRGEGYGRKLLEQITEEADKEGVTLMLEVYASGQLDTDSLIAWYRRHGFKMISYANKLMRRMPRAETPSFEEKFKTAC